MNDVFLSYSRIDKDFAGRVRAALTAQGYDVFWDGEIEPGAEWPRELEARINKAGCVLVLWSKSSRASRWVSAECEVSRKAQNFVAAAIEPSIDPPFEFRDIHAVDISGWGGDDSEPSWVKLERTISKRVRARVGAALSDLRLREEELEASEKRLDEEIRIRTEAQENLIREKRDHEQTRSELGDKSSLLADATALLKTKDHDLSDLRQRLLNLETSNSTSARERDDARFRLQQSGESLEAVQNELMVARRVLSDATAELSATKEALSRCEEIKQAAIATADRLPIVEKVVADQLVELEIRKNALERVRKERDELATSLVAREAALARDRQVHEEQLVSLRIELASSSTQVRRLQSEFDSVASELALLKEGKSSIARLHDGAVGAIKAVEALKRTGVRGPFVPPRFGHLLAASAIVAIGSVIAAYRIGTHSGSNLAAMHEQVALLRDERAVCQEKLGSATTDATPASLAQCREQVDVYAKRIGELTQQIRSIGGEDRAESVRRELEGKIVALRAERNAADASRVRAEQELRQLKESSRLIVFREGNDADRNGDATFARAAGTSDVDERFRLLQVAAAKRHPGAMHNLGLSLVLGNGTQRDENQAVIWFRLAAEHGNGEAALNLAQRYNWGRIVWPNQKAQSQDVDAAASLVRVALRAGSSSAEKVNWKEWGRPFCDRLVLQLVQEKKMSPIADGNCVIDGKVINAIKQ